MSVLGDQIDREIKLIAYYLPQFHEIPENNEFWGKGFTEWINVKAAYPLFKNHYQPREPYNENYYDLSDPNVMTEQMRLAKQYGIYGFCFYHYWFHGKKMLHKPLENLLNTKDGCLNYCIAWANEPWVTTWHAGGGKHKVLIEQEYGGPDEWNDHFDFLLKYFMDKRYIKVDNKPLLLIYNIDQIACRRNMFALWQKRARQNGFDGLHLLGMVNSGDKRLKYSYVSGSVDFCPGMDMKQEWKTKSFIGKWKAENGYTFSKTPVIKNHLHTKYDYERLCKKALMSKKDVNEYRCVFTGYDDTPRRREWSQIVCGASPRKFEKYLEKNLKKSLEENKEFLFINAWNEWGEGAYLEPDKKYGFGYLQAIRQALSVYRSKEK